MPSIETSWPLAEPAILQQAHSVPVVTRSLAIRRHFLAALGVSMVLLALLLDMADLRIDFWQPSSVAYGAAAALLLALRFGLPRSGWRHAGAVAHFSTYVGLFALISVMGAAASYPVAAVTHGYADATLQRIDLALGFDWLAWYRLTAAHQGLQFLETAAYRSIYVTPALLLWWMARAGEQERAWRFIATFWLAAVLTLLLFSLMPAVGPFSYLWHAPIHYMPESELWQQGLIPALRVHAVHAIDLGQLRGIVSAPSFHTAAAVLYIAAGWRIAALRWPVVVLNGAMLLSTPVEGTHYLIDMILGLGVALTALALMDIHRRHYVVSDQA
ncbi:phosphatase PAP2 family protein [Sphingobium sp. AP49]|uniref:phosphatase PAP2 family protein n=1 Tax=Sphingobium sp. AP49 TaxID=1144307 RepID=UPI00026EE761|nr:phosphatase PAP2 family protein [Sphingobium sp. AP49]WHO40213.1 phosphatase PAP2 family protein [Sphingobium sp. AP49]